LKVGKLILRKLGKPRKGRREILPTKMDAERKKLKEKGKGEKGGTTPI